MEGVSWVMYANMAVWLGIGGYLFFLCRKAAALEKRLRRIDCARQRSGEPGSEKKA